MFNSEEWCRKHTVPAQGIRGSWFYLILGKGDIRPTLDLGFSNQLFKHCLVTSIHEEKCTVFSISEGLLKGWSRARGSTGLFRCLNKVFSPEDLQKLFPEVCNAADVANEIKTKVTKRQNVAHQRHLKEGESREFRKAFSQVSSVRGAAQTYRT